MQVFAVCGVRFTKITKITELPTHRMWPRMSNQTLNPRRKRRRPQASLPLFNPKRRNCHFRIEGSPFHLSFYLHILLSLTCKTTIFLQWVLATKSSLAHSQFMPNGWVSYLALVWPSLSQRHRIFKDSYVISSPWLPRCIQHDFLSGLCLGWTSCHVLFFQTLLASVFSYTETFTDSSQLSHF